MNGIQSTEEHMNYKWNVYKLFKNGKRAKAPATEFFAAEEDHRDYFHNEVLTTFTNKMKQAEYEFNPIIKLVLFKTNKNRLELLITDNPNNAHLRYVRLLVQEKSPVFLGYKNNIVEDKTFLKRIMNRIDETDYLDSYIIDNTSL
jgi:hypothetical protein